MCHKACRDEGDGRECGGTEAEAERKPWGPNKSLKPASPKDRTVETQEQEESRPCGGQQPHQPRRRGKEGR